ncbi:MULTISPECIES: hypothetical protein [unclassified Synechococcus]|uniref:hypothetical protein n=1 Tax=unclassified Synechococcus TaxID=2626047 RepID=UPI00082982D9|nr:MULTISPECIES: hypothetical protein [unclassified Synechococcus]
MPFQSVARKFSLDRKIFNQPCDPKSCRLDIHGTLQGLAGRGHHRRELTPLENVAGFQVIPHAALDDGKKVLGSIYNSTRCAG